MVNIEPYAEPEVDHPLMGLVFYLYKGEYRIGFTATQDIRFDLEKSEDNLVKLIDGTTGAKESITIIRPITEKLDFNNEEALSANNKRDIIKYGYGAFITWRKGE